MKKEDICHQLLSKHTGFVNFISAMNEHDFMYSANEKWSAGQQLEHLILSLTPLTKIFLLPAFLIKLLFGKANRPSKNYDKLIEKYLLKIEQGGKAPGRFIPAEVNFQQRDKLNEHLLSLIKKLVKQVNGFTENKLDELIIPHPLLGKLTVREMLYFNIYHVQHHQKNIQRNLHASETY